MGTDTSLYKQFQPFGTDVFLWLPMSLMGSKGVLVSVDVSRWVWVGFKNH